MKVQKYVKAFDTARKEGEMFSLHVSCSGGIVVKGVISQQVGLVVKELEPILIKT